MGEVSVCFELLKKGVDGAGADVFLEVGSELGYELVAVLGALVELGEDVEAVKVC